MSESVKDTRSESLLIVEVKAEKQSRPETPPTVESTPVDASTTSADEQLKGYALFLEKLRDPSASPLVAKVKAFVSRFPKDLHRELASSRLHEFIATMEEDLPSIEVFSGIVDDDLIAVREGLEKLVLKPLHQHFFAIDLNDKIIDAQLTAKIERISSIINLQHHLHGPPELTDDGLLQLAVEEFKRIDAYRAPRDKLQCILNGFRVIRHALDEVIGENKWGADQLLPLCIYTIIRANPNALNSNLNFIQFFRHPSRLRGEDEYLLMQMSIAVKDILDIEEVLLREPQELTIEETGRMWKRFKKMGQKITELSPESEWADVTEDPTRFNIGKIEEFVKVYSAVVEEFNRLSR